MRPELWEHAEATFPVVWPENNLHGDVSSQYFSALYPRHAHVQVLVYDTELERVVARGRAIPFRWDGTLRLARRHRRRRASGPQRTGGADGAVCPGR